jgi:hypothetical protein
LWQSFNFHFSQTAYHQALNSSIAGASPTNSIRTLVRIFSVNETTLKIHMQNIALDEIDLAIADQSGMFLSIQADVDDGRFTYFF